MPYVQILCISYTCRYFQFPKFGIHPNLPYEPFLRHVGLILIFLEDSLWDFTCVHEAARLEVSLFRQLTPATFTGNAISHWQTLISGIYIAVVILTQLVQWLSLALSKGPNWAGILPPHLRTEADPVSETLCSLVFRIPEVQKPSNSECCTPSSERFIIYLFLICNFH
jgi:hypothetical protein